MTRPRVSIVVNTCNRAASLRRTLDSLRSLEYPEFEVVVVNGPSTDGTETVLADFVDVIKVGRCESANLSESRNIGIAIASGEILAFIDDDAYPEPDWLERLSEAFADPEVGAAGGPVYDHTGVQRQVSYSLANRMGDSWTVFAANPTDVLATPYGDTFVYTIGTNSAFRRDLLVQIGGFDEAFDYYLDEVDVCLRLVGKGFVVRALDNGSVHHKALASEVRASNRAIRNRYAVLKSRCYFALKHAVDSASFYDVCAGLVDFVRWHDADLRQCIDVGLLTEEDHEQFKEDTPRALGQALEEHRLGLERTRSSEWFRSFQQPFKRFPTLVPAEGRLRICFLSEEYPPQRLNGIGRVVHELATGLASEGHHVHVLVIGDRQNSVDLEDGVWVHRLAVSEHPLPPEPAAPRLIWDPSATLHRELCRIGETWPVDIVQVPNWNSLGIATLLDERFTTVLGLYTPLKSVASVDPRYDLLDPVVREMSEVERHGYSAASGWLACGPAIVDEIESRYGVCLRRDHLGLVPHGLRQRSSQCPRRVADRVNVLFVGRLEPRKGVDTLLACVPLLIPKFPDASFTIVGDDTVQTATGSTIRDEFERSPEGELYRERVRFTGAVDDDEIVDYYAGCDVFVAPSRFESFGLILLEAMMHGKPVVACDVGGMAEIVEHERSGLLVSPEDRNALADALARLFASPELRHKMGTRSRELFRARFTQRRMIDGVVGFYRALLHPSARPAVSAQSQTKRGETAADIRVDLLPVVRCSECGNGLAAWNEVVTADGCRKAGVLVCERCEQVAAQVENFKYDFRAVGHPLPKKMPPVIAPALGERRIRPADAEMTLVGRWQESGQAVVCEGRHGDEMRTEVWCTDAVLRFLVHPASGPADILVDGHCVSTVDLRGGGGLYIVGVPAIKDGPFARRTIAVRPARSIGDDSEKRSIHVDELVLYGPRDIDPAFVDPIAICRGNPYSSQIRRYLSQVDVVKRVLEIGGGDRRLARQNCVNFEYLPFELADAYGDAGCLPFKDDIFELTFSQAVFEHVPDPFAVADELVRVTRPGGLILTEVAFLQPLHAVPSHYFNMTSWGLEELFRGCSVVESDWFGPLSTTVEWLVESAGLREKVAADRLERLVGEFRELDSQVAHEDLKNVASGVYAVVRKET